jgi:hypothetical protein
MRHKSIAEIIDAYEHHADDSQSFREEARELLIAHEDEYFKTAITSLAEEAEREAEAHYNIAPPHRYHADLDQCKFKRAIAAWLRQKAEERSR